MSNTLTWRNSGLGAKTGTDVIALVNDLVSLFNSKSGDSNFSWQIAGSNNAGTPYYVVLKRKNGSAGRILVVIWTSAPAGNNSAILDTAPTNNIVYIAWFPNGTADTPSNLTASSGTILGNDSGAVKVAPATVVANVYGAAVQPFYFDTPESVFLGFQSPAATTGYCLGAGDVLVDASDNVYGGVFGSGTNSTQSFASSPQIPYVSAKPNAGSSTPCMRTNYGSVDRVYYQAWAGVWTNAGSASADYLTDSTTGKAFFIPTQLIGQLRDAKALDLKLRQVAAGPYSGAAFSVVNSSGPVTQATQFCGATVGGGGYPWFTNFKL